MNITTGYDPGFYSTLKDENWESGDLFNIRFENYKFKIFWIRIKYETGF